MPKTEVPRHVPSCQGIEVCDAIQQGPILLLRGRVPLRESSPLSIRRGGLGVCRLGDDLVRKGDVLGGEVVLQVRLLCNKHDCLQSVLWSFVRGARQEQAVIS